MHDVKAVELCFGKRHLSAACVTQIVIQAGPLQCFVQYILPMHVNPSSFIKLSRSSAARVGQGISWWRVCPATRQYAPGFAGAPPGRCTPMYCRLAQSARAPPLRPAAIPGEQLAPTGADEVVRCCLLLNVQGMAQHEILWYLSLHFASTSAFLSKLMLWHAGGAGRGARGCAELFDSCCITFRLPCQEVVLCLRLRCNVRGCRVWLLLYAGVHLL